jgi:hypothetical protein
VPGRELDVVGDERRPSPDESDTRSWVEPGGTVVWHELARFQTVRELLEAAETKERGAHPTAHLPVQESRDSQLAAERLGNRERRTARRWHLLGFEWDERDDVDGADARVDALVRPEVDPLACSRGALDERAHEVVRLADEREDRAMVIGIGVEIEKLRPPRERASDGRDRRRVTPLGDVRHRFQHDPYPTST